MSALTNQVHIIGHLGADPEIKTTTTGKKTSRLRVAAKEAYVNAEGKRVESTEWITVVAWEGLAERTEKFMRKGMQVAICGRIHTRDYVDAKGEKKWITEVIATDILMLGSPEKKTVEA